MSDESLHETVAKTRVAAELAAERSKLVLEQMAAHVKHDDDRFASLESKLSRLKLIGAGVVGLLVGAGVLGAQEVAKILAP